MIETVKALIKQNEEFADIEAVKKSVVASNYVRGKLDALKLVLILVDVEQ